MTTNGTAQGTELRERFIAETERTIDRLRERKDELVAEAADVEAQEMEARALLRLLKRGGAA